MEAGSTRCPGRLCAGSGSGSVQSRELIGGLSGVMSSMCRSSGKRRGAKSGMTPRNTPSIDVGSGLSLVVDPAPACDHRCIPEHAEPVEPTVSLSPPTPSMPDHLCPAPSTDAPRHRPVTHRPRR